MSLTVTDSSNISSLNSKIIVDLCAGNFIIDISPSVFIGSGANAMLGAKIKITNPLGVVVKDYTNAYDIAAPFTAAFTFPIPTAAGNYQYGEYQIEVQITDSDNTLYVFSKSVDPCYPDNSNKNRNYGTVGASLKAVCKDGKLYVSIDSLPTYNGLISSATTQTGTLEYPTSSNLPIRDITHSFFSDYLFEGVYKLKAEICASYIAEDNVTYKVKYKVNTKKEVFCQIDDCAVFASLADLNNKLTADDCSDGDKEKYSNISLEALLQYQTAKLANDCGEDASEYIKALQDILGCKCTCDIVAGAPVINSTPASDLIIEGCNVGRSVNGLTTIFTINNYDYVVSIPDNGGILTASAPTLTECTKTIPITFNMGAVYTQVKVLADQDNTEAAAWAAIVNKVLNSMDVSCLGSLGTGWTSKTFAQKITALKDAACVGLSIVVPSIPSIPDNVNGTIGNIPIFIDDAATNPASKSIGNSLLTQAGGQVISPFFAVSNTANTFPYALAVTKVLPINNANNILGTQSELHITGTGLTLTNEFLHSGIFGVLYFEVTGDATVLGRQHAGIVGSFVGSAKNATIASPMMASIAAAMDFTDNGIYQKVAGVFIDRPGNLTYSGHPDVFSGTIDTWYGVFISSSVTGGLSGAFITNRFGVYQQGENDNNVFAGKSSFSINLIVPTSNVHIKGLGYTQLRLETPFTPTGPSDARGAVGDVAWDNNYWYWKGYVAGLSGATRWNRIARDTTWTD